MRVKQIWDFLPVPSKLRLMWDRITISRLTVVYLVFAVLHCIVQVILQAQAFSINAQAAGLLSNVIDQGDAWIQGFPVLTTNGLRVCSSAPRGWSADSCEVVWSGATFNASAVGAKSAPRTTTVSLVASAPTSVMQSPSVVASSSSASTQFSGSSPTSVVVGASSVVGTPSPSASRSVLASVPGSSTLGSTGKVAAAIPTTSTTTVFVVATASATRTPYERRAKRNVGSIQAVNVNGSTEVQVTGFGWQNQTLQLSQKCLVALNWPLMRLDDTKREDITFIAFQIWVLGMSIAALLNESIPHIIASLLTHTLATVWAAFQISHTASFRADFNRLTTNGACGQSLLREYWSARADAEIPILVLNLIALSISGFLTWRLVKLFGWQTFKRIGASLAINRIYKLVLSLSIVIQLAVFFVIASAGVWCDQLMNGWVGSLASHPTLYTALIIVVCVLLAPWLLLGWIAVRREKRHGMIVFLVLCLAYIGSASGMFKAATFRWTFISWSFFAIINTASLILVTGAFILGVFCRLNFGKGLPRYLNAQEPLPGDNFLPVANVEAGLSRGIAYDDEKIEFPSPLGPGGPLPTYESAYGNTVGMPPAAHTRSPSERSALRELQLPQLARGDTMRSERSVGSAASSGSENTMRGKRWEIE